MTKTDTVWFEDAILVRAAVGVLARVKAYDPFTDIVLVEVRGGGQQNVPVRHLAPGEQRVIRRAVAVA